MKLIAIMLLAMVCATASAGQIGKLHLYGGFGLNFGDPIGGVYASDTSHNRHHHYDEHNVSDDSSSLLFIGGFEMEVSKNIKLDLRYVKQQGAGDLTMLLALYAFTLK